MSVFDGDPDLPSLWFLEVFSVAMLVGSGVVLFQLAHDWFTVMLGVLGIICSGVCVVVFGYRIKVALKET